MSHFAFLDPEWPDLTTEARMAENLAYPDPRTACFYARRTLEVTVAWLYKHDSALKLPYQDNLAALLAEPTFQKLLGIKLCAKTRFIKDLGNLAVHSRKRVQGNDAARAVAELFHITYWLAHNYARGPKPAPNLAFNVKALPRSSPIPPQTQQQLKKLEEELAANTERLSEILGQKLSLDEELKRLRVEIATVKAANSAILDTHDYSEAETRDYFIDLLLKEAGWPLDQKRDREFPVTGLPTEKGTGFVDYVLWGADGKPLALVEAKRTRKDARIGQQQAKLYADCLEKQFGQRPIIYYSNGYEHYVWDDVRYPPRPVQGFFKREELELAIQRRNSRKRLSPLDIDTEIVERYYQTRAITRIAEHFDKDSMRKALLVMATGAGKTRTVIALVDLLMRANWVKRVLFLADRRELVKQAHKAFTRHLPNASAVNLLNDSAADGRVMLSTYPTMMKLIDVAGDGERRFSPAHFDLIVVDEAHRSVYQKYRAIFEYFDCFLVGLTATPKDEIDRNTYSLFDLQSGVPTDVYSLDDAIADDYLVPPRPVSVPLKFMRGGIRYNDLTPEEQEEWDATEWSEDGTVPSEVDANEVNQWLFNQDTVDKVLQNLMERGEKVAGGDRLGKTVIFAKNRKHAHFIKERFDVHYPHLKGTLAAVIDCETVRADQLIEGFGKANGEPHIAISVDMLDTGIDVPEVVNLVFFKLVRSKTKFWQMVGRGTRLCADLYGPGQDKTHFWIFDYCQNLEFFSQDPGSEKGSVAAPLSERLFKGRLDLIAELDRREATPPSHSPQGMADAGASGDWPSGEGILRRDLVARLMAEIAEMPLDNFLVRPKRKLVEHYAKPESWETLGESEIDELADEVAGLPSRLSDPELEAKLFDVLMLKLQLGRLRNDSSFPRLAQRVRDIAEALEGKASIPMVQEQLEFILELQTDEFWRDVSVVRLETVRKQIRGLVKFIEKVGQKAVYTNFEDEAGEGAHITLPVGAGAQSFERFREKARHFLRPRERELPLQKLRLSLALTQQDFASLDNMLVDARLGTEENYQTARDEGLGLFVRSLVGLDRSAAMKAFEGFLRGRDLSANQQQFVAMIIEELTKNGIMDAGRLFETPFVDIAPMGVQKLFDHEDAAQIQNILHSVRRRAVELAES